MNVITFFAFNPYPSSEQLIYNNCAFILMVQTATRVRQHVYENLHRLVTGQPNPRAHQVKQLERMHARDWIDEQSELVQLLFDDAYKGAKQLLKNTFANLPPCFDRYIIHILDERVGRIKRNQMIEAIAYDTLVQAGFAT